MRNYPMTEAEKQPGHEALDQAGTSATESVPAAPTIGPAAAIREMSTSAHPSEQFAAVTQTDDADRMTNLDREQAAEIAKFNIAVKLRMRQKTRRSFLVGGAAAVAGAAGWRWLTTRRQDDSLSWPFRRVLEINEQFARDYFRRGRLAPAFPPQEARVDRVNGDVGLEEEIDISGWKLAVEGLAPSGEPLVLPLDEIKKLPRVDMTTELKCIEGWSVVVRWAGARFSDFMAAYPPVSPGDDSAGVRAGREDLPPYVSVQTPDGSYYVGLEMESMLHPQTLLCYEMNGAPLTQEHGAPLRLVIPVKYGVKNIKRIGKITYMRQRPADYWAEQGYDWYIGL
jgi:DMSO/TMAO reductase YedYZ molybdopterin-dependent catalytic subunit